MMGVDPFMLWVHKDSGITTFEQWVETVKAANGEYVMGGTGKGQEDSIVIAWLEQNFDIKVKYIPYKGGGEVGKELAGKQIMATVNNPSETKGFYANGDVVPLLSFSDERAPNFPDVRPSRNWARTSPTTTSVPLSARLACRLKLLPTTRISSRRSTKPRNGRVT
jgi:putative tricarboxylic transport membrane protein